MRLIIWVIRQSVNSTASVKSRIDQIVWEHLGVFTSAIEMMGTFLLANSACDDCKKSASYAACYLSNYVLFNFVFKCCSKPLILNYNVRACLKDFSTILWCFDVGIFLHIYLYILLIRASNITGRENTKQQINKKSA